MPQIRCQSQCTYNILDQVIHNVMQQRTFIAIANKGLHQQFHTISPAACEESFTTKSIGK